MDQLKLGSYPRLNVLSVAYPLFPVHAGAGGGAEQILGVLDRLLVREGHKSTVIAAVGSRVAGDLIEAPEAVTNLSESARRQAQVDHRLLIEEALQSRPIDLIHFHGLDFSTYRPSESRVPQLVTLHLPVEWYEPRIVKKSGVRFVCVSRNQAQSHAECHNFPVISNGIELGHFSLATAKQDFLLWLGRVCPEKGPHIALHVAHRLNLPLILAGPVHPFDAHQKYFANQVSPLIDHKRRYIGAIDRDQRSSLLSAARCVLLTALAPETSSLVAMEAAASGTPVVAFRSGALPEIVEDEKTGFLASSEEEMALKVSRTHELSPAICRQVAESRFAASRMFHEYLTLYRQSVT